jgi:holliday junction DNA helicase RuvB
MPRPKAAKSAANAEPASALASAAVPTEIDMPFDNPDNDANDAKNRSDNNDLNKTNTTSGLNTPTDLSDITINDSPGANRPKKLADYVGQERLKAKLSVYLQAAKGRKQPLDHTLLFGPPGLGKTTLAHIIAYEMGVNLRQTSGPAIEKPGDLAAILTNSLEDGDVLFIDEIHRLGRVAEEHLYPAMEDFKLDIVIGQGPAARSIQLPIPHFTLVGATTRPGLITQPMRSRFGIIEHLAFYTPTEIATNLEREAKLRGFRIDPEAALEIGARSRGTMRIAKNLLSRVRDYAQVAGEQTVSQSRASDALDKLGLDTVGLNERDIHLLEVLIKKFAGGPVGLDTLATAISEDALTIEDLYEPYLIQLGFMKRTPRGRVLTPLAYDHLDYAVPQDALLG